MTADDWYMVTTEMDNELWLEVLFLAGTDIPPFRCVFSEFTRPGFFGTVWKACNRPKP